jgi:fused signal recognition particle receptor
MWWRLFFKKKKKKGASVLFSKEHYNDQTKLQKGLKGLFKNEAISFEQFLKSLEELFLTSDVSLKTTLAILEKLQTQVAKEDSVSSAKELLRKILDEMIIQKPFPLMKDKLNIILVFGINGVGKTTSVAKMTSYFTKEGLSLVVAAADTYRAAAADQLKTWMERLGVQLVYHQGKSKPSAVVFDALDSSLTRKKDMLLIDTAGRIHTREDLLEELAKLKKIITQKAPDANVIHLLVLDATTGQNALSQAKHFKETVGIDGVFLSKADSSGKGGSVLSLSYEYELPIFFLGVGEKADDILPFSQQSFVNSLLGE